MTACGDQIGLGHFNRSYGRGLITWVACHSNGLQCSYVLTMITTYTITFKCNYASRTLTIILMVYGSENKFQIFYGFRGYTIDYANTKAKKLPNQIGVRERCRMFNVDAGISKSIVCCLIDYRTNSHSWLAAPHPHPCCGLRLHSVPFAASDEDVQATPSGCCRGLHARSASETASSCRCGLHAHSASETASGRCYDLHVDSPPVAAHTASETELEARRRCRLPLAVTAAGHAWTGHGRLHVREHHPNLGHTTSITKNLFCS